MTPKHSRRHTLLTYFGLVDAPAAASLPLVTVERSPGRLVRALIGAISGAIAGLVLAACGESDLAGAVLGGAAGGAAFWAIGGRLSQLATGVRVHVAVACGGVVGGLVCGLLSCASGNGTFPADPLADALTGGVFVGLSYLLLTRYAVARSLTDEPRRSE